MLLTLLLGIPAFCIVGSAFAAMLMRGGYPAPPVMPEPLERVDA
jgi:hypothetical protein